MRRAFGLVTLALMTATALAEAQGPAPSGAPAGPSGAGPSGAVPTGEAVEGCVEQIPKGAVRPVVTETFPPRGTSGWAATLSITVRHGKGEKVLPAGLDLGAAVEAKKYLQKAGFVIPEQDGGAGAHLATESDDKNNAAVTHLELPLVVLPEKPGRNVMQLPPLPVAVQRPNGEIATVCTHPHSIVVEDPIANTPQAMPKENPPPLPQREEWTSLKRAVIWGGLGTLVGAVIAYSLYKHLTKPKPPPPPPPPRPPWEVALERLDEVRHAGLLESQRHGEYFDRVSDAVRGYLGARFGFDGLESTTDEILTALKKHAGGFVSMSSGETVEGAAPGWPTPGIPIETIRLFLSECDLVKFANLTPTPEQCATSIVIGEQIVRGTMPLHRPAAPATAASHAKEEEEEDRP